MSSIIIDGKKKIEIASDLFHLLSTEEQDTAKCMLPEVQNYVNIFGSTNNVIDTELVWEQFNSKGRLKHIR